MQKNIGFLLLAALLVGCGGESVHDGSQGPRSTISQNGLSTNSIDANYHDSAKVTIEAVKSYGVEGVAVDIALSDDGDIAYIASGDGGLEVIDISSPSSPHLLYSYDLAEYVNYVTVKDGVVYVAYIPEGLSSYARVYAFDVGDPYHPYYLGSDEGNSGVGHHTLQQGNYLYKVNQEGLAIYHQYGRSYDKVGSYYLHDSAYALALKDNYIFIANGRVGLTILKTDVGGRVGQVH